MYSFVNTLKTRVNRSIGKPPKNVKKSLLSFFNHFIIFYFLSFFYKNPTIEYKKPRFEIGQTQSLNIQVRYTI